MILTQAGFKQARLKALTEGGEPGAGGASPAAPVAPTARDTYRSSVGSGGRGGAQTPEPGFFGKAWKLFKRYVLYMN